MGQQTSCKTFNTCTNWDTLTYDHASQAPQDPIKVLQLQQTVQAFFSSHSCEYITQSIMYPLCYSQELL